MESGNSQRRLLHPAGEELSEPILPVSCPNVTEEVAYTEARRYQDIRPSYIMGGMYHRKRAWRTCESRRRNLQSARFRSCTGWTESYERLAAVLAEFFE